MVQYKNNSNKLVLWLFFFKYFTLNLYYSLSSSLALMSNYYIIAFSIHSLFYFFQFIVWLLSYLICLYKFYFLIWLVVLLVQSSLDKWDRLNLAKFCPTYETFPLRFFGEGCHIGPFPPTRIPPFCKGI